MGRMRPSLHSLPHTTMSTTSNPFEATGATFADNHGIRNPLAKYPALEPLTRALEAHGHDWRVLADGRLQGLNVWTRDGRTGATWESIPATMQDVRAWMGY